jgi:hypothetical protein
MLALSVRACGSGWRPPTLDQTHGGTQSRP